MKFETVNSRGSGRKSTKLYKEILHYTFFNPLNANPEKWSNTLKQIVGNMPTICLSVFDHFMNLALKGLNKHPVYKQPALGTQFAKQL